MRLTYKETESLRGNAEFEAFCEAIRDAAEPCTLQDTADVFASLKAAGLLCTAAEREVLKACDTIPEQELRSSGNWYGWAKPIGEAVRAWRLSRRAAEKESNG